MPAADLEHLPAHPTGVVRRQEDDHGGHVRGLANVAQRDG